MLTCSGEVVSLLREDFKENEAHIPAVQEDLVNGAFLDFEVVGAEGTFLKLSHHPEADDPHYLWWGLMTGETAALFTFAEVIDFSDPGSKIRMATRNTWGAKTLVMVKSAGVWWVSLSSPTGQGTRLEDPFVETEYVFQDLEWGAFGESPAESKKLVSEIDWARVEGVGFYSPFITGVEIDGREVKGSARLDWFELFGKRQGLPEMRVAGDGEKSRFFEKAVPFFMSGWVVNEENEVKRGVVVRLAGDFWVGFDTDSMRPAAVWEAVGDPLSLDSMAACSYPDLKAKAKAVPQVLGEVVMESLWRSEAEGIFRGVEVRGKTPVIRYELGEALVEESWRYEEKQESLVRLLELAPHKVPLEIVIDGRSLVEGGEHFTEGRFRFLKVAGISEEAFELKAGSGGGTSLFLSPSTGLTQVAVVLSAREGEAFEVTELKDEGAFDFFPAATEMNRRAEIDGRFSYEMKYQELPQENVYGRAIRPMDVAFDSEGVAYLCTLDGDVWQIQNIHKNRLSWKRFAHGLYELTNILIGSDDRIYVLGRDQITELVDRNGDGAVDEYRCVNNQFIQTLQTRDFSLSMDLLPNGNFLITKGGIMMGDEGHSLKHRGTILEVEPDQGEVKIIADGMRMPYVGVDAQGRVFASDQQGHFIPSTPLYEVKAGDSFGFEATNVQGRPIQDPFVWFPYLANRSGAGFVKLTGGLFVPFDDLLAHISWDGRLFGVNSDDGPGAQNFAWRLPLALKFSTLNGAVNPKNGKLYLTGLGISGYRPTTDDLMGLVEVTPPKKPLIPTSLKVGEEGIQVVFSKELPTQKQAVASLKSWDVKRSESYGSGHYNWVGDPGENEIQIKGIEVKGKTLMIETERLFDNDILEMKLSWGKGTPLEIYASVNSLGVYDPKLASRVIVKDPTKVHPPDSKRGGKAFREKTCVVCHSIKGEKLAGPPMNGIGQKRTKAELRQSILEPHAVIADGYTNSMPSYAGVLSEQELVDIVEYLSKK